jgi:alkylation response protein AidB-like acyl-CoA dehydrogenase
MAVRLAELLQRLETWTPVALRSQPELRGWSGLDLAQRHGGAAWSARDMASLFCRCGRLDVELRDLAGAGHARLLSLVSTRHFDAVLDAVAAGSNYCAIAITEPDVGSDVRSIATTATAIDGGYLLDGVKQHISRIHECTHFIVFAAVTRAAVTAPGITAFLIPRDAAGLVTEPMSPAGLASVSWGRICLQQVKAPSASRIGGEGQAMSLFSRHFSYWRTLMAALAIGSAQAAVDQAAAWMKTRQAFGGPIGRFSHLQQALAEWTARLRMVWLLVEDVAAQIDSRRWPTVDAAMLKAEAMETALAATAWSMTVLGGAGYALEAGLEKRHRDLAGLRIADGATDVLRGQVARAVLGERLYELSLNRSAHVGHLPDTSRRQFW